MLKSNIFTFLFISFMYNLCIGQNLVVDPSFEEMVPRTNNDTWTTLRSKNDSSFIGMRGLRTKRKPKKLNDEEFQYRYLSPRTGYQMFGANLFSNNGQKRFCGSRDFFRGSLKSPLVKDAKYRISMYARFGGNDVPMTEIGVLLSSDSLSKDDLCSQEIQYLSLKAETKYISKYNEWQKIEAFYTAKGGESFLHIGGFLGANLEAISEAKSKYDQSFYFFDDVELLKVTEDEFVKGKNGDQYELKEYNKILFDDDTETLDDEYSKYVMNIAEYLLENPAIDVEIFGHSDNAGSDRFNQNLSSRRVSVVEKELVNNGVLSERIRVYSNGSIENIANKDIEEEPKLNRKVDVKLKYKDEMKAVHLEALYDFAKLYGYVRYFFPEDLNTHLDWNNFAAFGVQQIRMSKNKSDCIKTIEKLFSNISNTILVLEEPNVARKLRKLSEYKFWQHLGLQDGGNAAYESKLVNSRDKEEWLFEEEPDGSFIEEIGKSGVFYAIPLKLELSSSIDKNKIEKFNTLIEKHLILEQDEFVANTIIVWNVVQHFYPYLDYLELDWESTLSPSLAEAVRLENTKDFDQFIKKLVVRIKDGNATVYHKTESVISGKMRLPFMMTNLNDRIEVIESGNKKILRGDVIEKIDGEDAFVKFKSDTVLISGSSQWKVRKGLLFLGADQKNTVAEIEVERSGDTIKSQIVRDWGRYPNSKSVEDPKGGVYIINLKNIRFIRSIGSGLVKLKNPKAIVFDVRGCIGGDFTKMLPYLMSVQDTVNNCFQTPQIVNPNQNNLTFKKEGWELQPKEGLKNSVECYFLIDETVIGASESFISFVKHYKLGTVIGSPTAGANGSKNWIELLGGYKFTWTGMYVTDLDNNCYHYKGIVPDILMYPTTYKEDEVLNKSLELIAN